VKIVELEFGKGGANIVTFTRDKLGRLKKKRFKHTHYIYEEDPNGAYTTLMGHKVGRKNFKKFWDVKKYIKTSEKPTYEDDLPYTKRWLLDHGSQLESEGQPRVMFYDIETTGFSSTDDQIISIVAHDSYNNMYYEFIWSPDHECDSERKMLIEFAKVIKNVDPDILSGWNSDKFDLPFVVDRMDHLNVPVLYGAFSTALLLTSVTDCRRALFKALGFVFRSGTVISALIIFLSYLDF